MIKLYHYPLCPFSRQIRLLLKEYGFEFSLIKEDYWLRRKEFMKYSPSGDLPVILYEDGSIVSDVYAIIEYINDISEENIFISNELNERLEMRRLISWFNNKFYREVTKYILNEKVIRLFTKAGAPKSELIHIAKNNLHYHLEYITNLLENNEFIAYDRLSIADFVAASHISTLDFFGEISWRNYPRIQEWYVLVKSRPSFRSLLSDIIPGFSSPKHYVLLDF